MPAVNTGGFSVQAMPRTNFVDTSLLTPAYGQILPNIMYGAESANKLYKLASEARMRPMREQLAQIELQGAQDKAATPQYLPGDITYSGGQVAPEDMPAIDELGNRTGPMYKDLIQITNRQQVQNGQIVGADPLRKTLKTAAEQEADAAKAAASIRAQDALVTQRLNEKEFESVMWINKRNEAAAAGDQPTANLYQALIDRKAAMPGILQAGTYFNRRVETLAADAAVTQEVAQDLMTSTEGMRALVAAATINKARARGTPSFGIPKQTPRQELLLSGGGRDAVGAVPNVVTAPAKPMFTLNTTVPSEIPAEINAAIGEMAGAKSAPIPATFPIMTVAEAKSAPAGAQWTGIDGKKYYKGSDGRIHFYTQ